MAFGAPTWSSKPHSKFNLALLGSIFGALATLRIELSPRRELNSHGSGIFAVQALLDCCFAALQWVSDAFWTQLGGSWESLGALLVALRPVLADLGALLAALGRLLGRSWAPLGGSCASLGRLLGQLGFQAASKWPPSGLQVGSKCSKWLQIPLQALSKWSPSDIQMPPSRLQAPLSSVRLNLTFELS